MSSNKDLDQLKKSIKNLEYKYRQMRPKMASTGGEGAKKLQSNCAFYEELDDILETRDAISPDHMTISSASDESPPKSQQVPPKTKGKASKRKRKDPNDQD